MADKVKISGLENACTQALNDYRKVTFEALKKAVDKTTKKTVDAIKGRAPRKTGKYAGDWSSKKMEESSVSYGRIVYNRKHYQLTHLLEHGHVIKGYLAKRTTKTSTRAFPHIPSDDETESMFTEILTEEVDKV